MNTNSWSSVFLHAVAHGVAAWPWWTWALLALVLVAKAIDVARPRRKRSHR